MSDATSHTAEADPVDGPYAWRRLAVSLALSTVGGIGLWSVVVTLPVIEAEFGIDRGEASFPYTMTMIGYALGNFAVGRIIDRFGVTAALSLSAVIIAGGMGLAAISPSVLLLAGLQLVIGFGTGASFGPLMTDVSMWFLKRRGIAVAITACGNYLSGAVWPLMLAIRSTRGVTLG